MYAFQKKDAHDQLARWLDRLEESRFEISYRPVTKNHAAVFLSRYAGIQHGFDKDEDDFAFPVTDLNEHHFSGLEPYYATIGRYVSGMKLDELNSKLWEAVKRNFQKFIVWTNKMYRRTNTGRVFAPPVDDRLNLLQTLEDHICHRNTTTTNKHIQDRLWWCTMVTDISNYKEL